MDSVKIARHFDAVRLNEIINHPSVQPYVRGSSAVPLDMTQAVADRKNVLLMGEHGGILFVHIAPGLYEAHSQALPEGRGKWMLAATRAALRWMFCATPCIEVMSKIPHGNVAARALASAVGLRHEFSSAAGWVLDGKTVPADIFALRVHDWMRIDTELPERGRAFLAGLDKEFARFGLAGPADPGPDQCRYAGAALQMILGGQAQKAVILYNRWAALAGHQSLKLVSVDPVAIDLSNALVVVRGNGEFYLASASGEPAAATVH